MHRFLRALLWIRGVIQNLLIDLEVFLSGAGPREVSLHSVDTKSVEQFRFSIQYQGFPDGFGQSGGRVFHEFNAVGLQDILHRVDHGVVEPSGGADNGDRAIPQAVHLQ